MDAQERDRAMAYFNKYEGKVRRLARSWANRKACWDRHRDDIEQAALIGLWEASQRIDDAMAPSQQSAYVKRMALGRILDHFRSFNGTIYSPKSAKRRPKCYAISHVAKNSKWKWMESTIAALRVHDDHIHEREDFNAMTMSLSPRDREILWSYYGEGEVMRRIGAKHGISESRTNQIIHDCLSRLKRTTPVLQAVGAA